MKLVILLCFLVVVAFVQAKAHPHENEGELEVERSARSVAARRPNAHPARRRRFRTKPRRHGRQYYQRMIGLRTTPAYWKKPVQGNVYNALQNVFSGEQLPASFSWADKPNIVTPVKHQGECGSCYSFAAAAAIESMLAIWNKKPNLDLSEQEIVDCSQQTGNFGCNGGLMENAYQWIANNKGLTLENIYPYRGVAGRCRPPRVSNYATAMTYTRIPPGNEDGLRNVVYHLGPVSIGIHTNLTSFFEYDGGIYDDEECNLADARVDHAVLIVGWGEDNGEPYWLIKNSWGTEWGENGYVKLLRGSGQCKIGQMASVPIVNWVRQNLLTKKPVRHNF